MFSNTTIGLTRLAIDLALVWMVFGRPGKRGSAKILEDGRIEFAPDWIGLYGFLLAFVYVIGMAVRHFLQAHGGGYRYIGTAVSVVIALYILISIPGTVVASDDRLEAIFWFRKNKLIRWHDIKEIEADRQGKLFSIVAISGVDGTRIVHSWLLADLARLMLEVQRHCEDELPAEFPRQSGDGS
jgi:hypothetical protein